MFSQKKDTGEVLENKAVCHILKPNGFYVYFNTTFKLENLYFEEKNWFF